MTEMIELEMITFDELENSTDDMHIFCVPCHPDHAAGCIVIALCGTMYRSKGLHIKYYDIDDVECETCLSSYYCPKCGTRMLPWP